MTSTREKLQALFLAVIMLTSVMAGTIALSGAAGAANTAGNIGISASPDDERVTSTHKTQINIESSDGVVSSSLTGFNVDYSVGTFASNSGDVSNVNFGDVQTVGIDKNDDGDVQDTDDEDLSSDLASVTTSNNGETLEFGFGGSYTIQSGDRIIVEFADAQNPSAGSSPYNVDLVVNPQSAGTTASASLNIAGNNEAVLIEPNSPTVNNNDTSGTSLDIMQANDVFYAAIPQGAVNVTTNNVTAVHNFNGNAKQIDTSQSTSISGTTYYYVTFQAAKDSDSDVTFLVNGNEFDAEDYQTSEFEVRATDTVIFNSTTSASATIYKGPGTVADDQQFEYQLRFVDPNGGPGNATLSTVSDTNNGQLSVTAAFEIYDGGGKEYLRDYRDDTSSNSGPFYQIRIDDNTNDNVQKADVVGSAAIDSRLDVSSSASNAVYDQTGQVSGTAVDAEDTEISGYEIKFIEPDGGDFKTTQTAESDFGFTVVFEDAGDWEIASNEGGQINYSTVTVAAQQANLDLTSDGQNRGGFNQTYTLNLTDVDGNAINTYDSGSPLPGTSARDAEGYVNVTGEFSSVDTSDSDFLRQDNTGTIDFFHVATDADGEIQIDATPTTSASSVTASAENLVDPDTQQGTSYPADSDDVTAAGLEVPQGESNDAATTPLSPDYAASASLPIGGADPVNIVDRKVQDPQTQNAPDSITQNPPVYETLGPADQVDDPSVINVLPTAQRAGQGDGARFDGGPNDDESRLGFDERKDESGITAYRVQFELRDASGGKIMPGNVESITIEGAGINATVDPSGSGFNDDGLVDADYDDVDGDGNMEYTHLVRPTSVDDPDETVTVTVDVTNEAPVSFSAPAQGLFIEQFQVDGESVTSVSANQDIDIDAQVKNPATSPVFVNNGRTRLTQEQNTGPSTTRVVQLNETDARTASVNNGLYSFNNVQVGPRGLDNDSDAVGEDTADLTFTSYQYEDVDEDNQIEQQEVNNATLETLDLAPNSSLQIEYDAENTSTYSGVDNGTFTLTKGIEYQQIAFELTDANDNPVNLTEGLRGEQIGTNGNLNTISHPGTFSASNKSNNPILVNITTENGGVIQVHFDNSQSNPSEGYYVISDVEQVTQDTIDLNNDGVIGPGESGDTVQAETTGSYSNGDSFVFGSISTDDSTSYTVNIETPDRNFTTADGESDFVTEQAQIEQEVIFGVAGNAVPNSQDDDPTDTNNFVHDDLAHDQTDQVNTNTSGIETPSITNPRTYRINATVKDALGTPLNASDFGRVQVRHPAFEDRPDGSDGVGNDFGFYAPVNGPDVGIAGTAVNIQNQNGSFQYDVEGNLTNNGGADDGILTSRYEIEARDSSNAPTTATGFVDPESRILVDEARNPVVEFYDENGGDLPVNQQTGNQILAKDVDNKLRVEVFPADQDDFPLADGQGVSLRGPLSAGNNLVFTDTKSVEDFQNTQLATERINDEPVTTGQVGFLTAEPTGTGDAIVSANLPAPNGSSILFDVLRSNRELSVDAPDSVETGESVSLTFTDQRTDNDPVDTVTVIVEAPSGNTTTLQTDARGVVTVPGSFIDESGQFTISTRRAGYAPLEDSFDVTGAAGPQVKFTGATLDPNGVGDNQTVTHTLTVDIANVSDDGNTDSVSVQFPSAVESVSLNSVTVTDADGNNVAVTDAGTSGNIITFSVSPDSSADTRDLTAEVSVDVGFPDVSQDTTADISTTVDDSDNGQDTTTVPVTIIDETVDDGDVVDRFDDDGDGEINLQELLAALAVYDGDAPREEDSVNTQELLELLAVYNGDA